MSNLTQPQFTFTLPSREPQRSAKPWQSKALWFVGFALLANAAAMVVGRAQVPDVTMDRAALAQATPAGGGSTPMLGARGIYMMPAQIGPNSYGLYLLDVDSSTICVYQALPDGQKFKFMASRSFKYDRFMEDFNNEGLRPKDIQKIVQNQQQRTDLHEKDDQPTVDQTTKPSENLPDPAKNAPGN
jgi:hypothetical protein